MEESNPDLSPGLKSHVGAESNKSSVRKGAGIKTPRSKDILEEQVM